MTDKTISIDIDHSLHKQAKSLANERDVPVRTIYADALRNHLATGAPTSPAREFPYAIHNRVWHDLLDGVLADPAHRLGITSNLEWAANHLKRRGGATAAPMEEDLEFVEMVYALESIKGFNPDNEDEKKLMDRVFKGLRTLAASAARAKAGVGSGKVNLTAARK
jgi:hypothetical protein